MEEIIEFLKNIIPNIESKELMILAKTITDEGVSVKVLGLLFNGCENLSRENILIILNNYKILLIELQDLRDFKKQNGVKKSTKTQKPE